MTLRIVLHCVLQALRRELNFMEAEALKFAAALENASDTNCDPTKLTAQLEGRFRFLWGIYRAHSEVWCKQASTWKDCNQS